MDVASVEEKINEIHTLITEVHTMLTALHSALAPFIPVVEAMTQGGATPALPGFAIPRF